MKKFLLFFAVLMICYMTASAVGTQPSGEGTSANPYQIATKDNLLWFADYVNQGNLTVCAILTEDITVNNGVLDSNGNLNSGEFETWTPIGSWGSEPNTYKGFAGEFNGNGHTISGLYFNDETKAPVGLFGMADNNGYIHDVSITDSYFCGKSHVAGICGDLAYGRIENCWNAAIVIGTIDCAGGITGSCYTPSSVSGCYNIGKVSSINSNVCGGICGSVTKNVDDKNIYVSNCVSLEDKCDRAYNLSNGTDISIISNVSIQNPSAFASGDVCWILNGRKIDTKWRQQIGKDSYPVFTGNYLVNYYSGSPSYCYNETMCEKSSNGIHNFERRTIRGCNGDTFYYWHCTHCGNDYSYEGDDGHKNQTKEVSQGSAMHRLEWVQAVLPTATTAGRYEHWHCTACDKNFFDEQCTVEATEATLTVPVAKNNEIWYTTTDNKKLTPNNTDKFGANYNDNVYEKGLGKITFDTEVTIIGQQAFEDCSRLTSIVLPNSVKEIAKYAFGSCSNLITAHLPEGVSNIGDYAFNNCSKLQSVTIPGSVKSMGNFVFDGCTSLKDVTIEDGAYIGESVFKEYTGTITINGSLSGVGDFAFASCTGLTSVSVKSGSIGSNAFAFCTGLTSVSLLEGVNSIEVYAFQNCSNLKDIFVKWSEAEKMPNIDWTAFFEIDLSKVTLHVPTNTTALYKSKDVWKDFWIVEDVNFIITKTDDTTTKQQVVDGGEITIDERSRNIKSLVVSGEVEHVSVTYYRNFANAGKWQAWYVPFDVDVADMAQAGLNVAEIYGILLDNSGNTVLAFLKMNAGTVKANTPYVVRPKEYGDVTVTTTTTLYPTKATQFAINSAKDTYTFGGIYEQTTTPGKWYAVNTSGQFQKMGTGVNLQPMRIWMTIDPRDDNPYTQPTEANAKMDIMVIGDDEPTGIESLTPTLSEGKGAIYNLQGQRVKSIMSGQIYIMNGKKYMAR